MKNINNNLGISTPSPLEKAGMRCIIAEKPSVAQAIAVQVGATSKQGGYLQGNGYLVTWAFGHLVQLAFPEHYGLTGFKREQLPIIPATFILKPRQVRVAAGYKDDPSVLKQLAVIRSVFDKSDKIIVATDAGREGELIFRHIYNYLGCTKPFDRLWISSLTDKAITDGLKQLKNGRDYDCLYQAAKARSEADWLVGINASQAISIAAGQGVFSLGRVQTPTLAMICSRYLEHQAFIPTPYWDIRLDASFAKTDFSAVTCERILSRNEAKERFEKQKQQRIVRVESVEQKETTQEPPLLYDLTSLQKEANTRYGFSADKTLTIAQKLYESKHITYPRTGSRYISDDVFEEIPALIQKLEGDPFFARVAKKMAAEPLNTRSVNTQQVTDHHALLITGYPPQTWSCDELKLYKLIAGRMLESFSRACVKDITTVTLNCQEILYQVKGTVTKEQGWRDVFHDKNNPNKEKQEECELPPLAEGQELVVSQFQLLEKLTKPKPLHSEASLLGAMETAGRELESEEQRLALQTCGIGTPATRAAIIETLFNRDYMVREKKSLVPTAKGLAVYAAVKDTRIADVEMTGMWEQAFAKIESGEQQAGHFKKGIEIYTEQITNELLQVKLDLPAQEVLTCPKCKAAAVNFYTKVVKCSNPACDLLLFSSICGKKLSNDIMDCLLTGKETAVLKGFKSKVGKRFDAALVLDDAYKITFVFDHPFKKKQ